MNSSSPIEEVNRGLPPWLASTLLRRRDLAPRFVYWRQRLARQSRGWRRRLRRQLAVGVTSAALLLAVAGARAQIDPAATDNTITVVNGQIGIAANGQCSLFEAIQNANNKANGRPYTDCAAGNPNGADTINLPTNGLFTIITPAVPDAPVGPIGLPWITTAMTINGNGSIIQRGNTAPDLRILAVGYQGNLTLNNTTIRGGQLSHIEPCNDAYDVNGGGGGILNQGQLTISGGTIADNYVYCHYVVGGGGIFNSGTLTITGSIIEGNNTNGYFGTEGGGIYNIGALTITGSEIRDNTAFAYSGADGGGIHSEGSLSLNDSEVSGNATFGNHGASAGGVYAAGQLTIRNSEVRSNWATGYDDSTGAVGVLATDTSAITGSTIVANSAGPLGDDEGVAAIGNYGTMTIANSTVSGNKGQGVANHDYLTIANSTITNNMVGVYAECYGSTTRLLRTIVSGNTDDEIFLDGFYSDDCSTDISVNSHNIFGKNGNAGVSGFTPGPTDIVPTVGINAILSPLAENGGPTQTHALPAGSPALDRAPNASCTAAPVNGLDQRGQPRNQNGSGNASNNECDVGAFERASSAPPPTGGFYLSPGKAGTFGGVAFAPADIIKYDPATGWSMHFDGSDVGITKNVSAFELQSDGSILLSLGVPQSVPGVGSVAAHDVLRFAPTSTGLTTAGSFQMWVDGSNVGLTTSAERVDALGLSADGRIAISTVGAVTVAGPNGATLKAANEDALAFNRTNATWSTFFDSTSVIGMGPENVNAIWVNTATGEVYVSFPDAFNFNGVTGDAKDIVKLTPNGSGGYTPSLYWDGSAAGFPVAIDGLEMIN